jgi:hypothetical protein
VRAVKRMVGLGPGKKPDAERIHTPGA